MILSGSLVNILPGERELGHRLSVGRETIRKALALLERDAWIAPPRIKVPRRILKTTEEEEEFGNDPIVIYQGDMWLGGKYLNVIFHQNLPRSTKHRISLVQNLMDTTEPGEPGDPSAPETVNVAKDGYVHLELRYNTYDCLLYTSDAADEL